MVNTLKNYSLNDVKQKILANKKYSAAIVILVILIIFAIGQNIDFLDSFTAGEDDITKETQNIENLQKKLRLDQNKIDLIKSKKLKLAQKTKEFWIPERDGQANIVIQKNIDSLAKKSNVDLKTLGTIRVSPIGDGIASSEFDISCSAALESIVRFIYDISNSQPKLYWDRCLLRPDNIKDPKIIYLTGSLQFITVENDSLREILLENKTK